MPLSEFHQAVADWFARRFAAPTPAQRQAWPAIGRGQHTLIAAPTGSGKTLAAFLAAIDGLVRAGVNGQLTDTTQVLYVSPLKALSNDIQRNLEAPLQGITEQLAARGLPEVAVRALVRSGDTPQRAREQMRRCPPHILVTTPESLYILLTSDSGRQMLRSVRSVIVDEIHAMAGNKRGAHLALSLERLEALCEVSPVRIGLSATQRPIEAMSHFLTGDRDAACTIVDIGHSRARDLRIEVTGSPLEAVMANEVWGEIYDRLAQLIGEHRTTLIFVNTRRLAERAAAALAQRLGETAVTAHHGSLAREHRLDAEQRLKQGRLRALVATASLELGIDIGEVDLVCQLGSPHAISILLQRVGRSGHGIDGLPKGRLFPLSRDDLLECAALLDAVQRDELDRIPIPHQPLDVLAQQVVAEVASREWDEQALYQQLIRAWPYRELTLAQYQQVVAMLSDGYTTRRGRRSAYLHRDAVNRRLRGRRGARLTALTNGGAIPDQFDYDVILQPQGTFIGTLNEDFAFESLPGDIFQLGNTSYRMLKIEQGRVHVEDAHGQPPNIPFWFGEAPGRSDELSQAVSRLRGRIDTQLAHGEDAAQEYLIGTLGLPQAVAQQLGSYLAAAKAALDRLPTQQHVVFERFLDETGDMHLVVHAPFGSRINRAWGLSLRKRFCRKFNFELQAAANEDSIVLSLGATHSFPLEEVARYLNAATVRQVLTQAVLTAPMFATRWRWVANTALAVPRNRGGKRVPAPFQRNDAEDLIALVFPDQLACQENVVGERDIPDHPLVTQTLADCLNELMDVAGLEHLLRQMEHGAIEITARDLAGPSPLAQEILTARPYAFLDDAPAEERRTLAIQQRRFADPADAASLGRLDPAAIAKVRAEAWPTVHSADELHDALCLLGFLTEAEGEHGASAADAGDLAVGWSHLLVALQQEQRATALTTPSGRRLWVAAERLHLLQRLYGETPLSPSIAALNTDPAITAQVALEALIRSRLQGSGPVSAAALAAALDLDPPRVETALLALEQDGGIIRGRFSADAVDTEWCERGLLARIHRYTLQQLRSEIEPVAPADFMRFLFHWQRLDDPPRGEEALRDTLAQLEGLSLPAGAWTSEVLPARVAGFTSDMVSQQCSAGRLVWLRLQPPARGGVSKTGTLRSTPIALVERGHLAAWRGTAPTEPEQLSGVARKVHEALGSWGASFFVELVQETGLLRTQVEAALSELVSAGLVTADSFAGLRALTTPQQGRRGFGRHRRARDRQGIALDEAGRWSLLRPVVREAAEPHNRAEIIAAVLLKRYGVVFRALLEREAGLPPWRELLYVYRRMEARGELRGGRFVQGFSGEQFALPETLPVLRRLRREGGRGAMISVSGADPLNLTGIVTPGERIPAHTNARVVYRDGIPVAVSVAGRISLLQELAAETQWQVRNALLRGHNPAGFHPAPDHPV